MKPVMLDLANRILKAEEVVHEVVSTWRDKEAYRLTTIDLIVTDLGLFFAARNQTEWFADFGIPRWRSLVEESLYDNGYVEFEWGWGRKHS